MKFAVLTIFIVVAYGVFLNTRVTGVVDVYTLNFLLAFAFVNGPLLVFAFFWAKKTYATLKKKGGLNAQYQYWEQHLNEKNTARILTLVWVFVHYAWLKIFFSIGFFFPLGLKIVPFWGFSASQIWWAAWVMEFILAPLVAFALAYYVISITEKWVARRFGTTATP